MARLRIAVGILALSSVLGGLAIAQLPKLGKSPEVTETPAEHPHVSAELLKQEMLENQKDLQKMQELVASVQEELQKSKQYALPVRSVKQLEEIEKIAKRIRGRLKRF